MSDLTQIQGVTMTKQGELDVIEIDNAFATARMTTLGASVLSFCPKDAQGNVGEDVMWVSDTAIYDGKAAVRGGVPICWPWFGGYKAEFNSPLAQGAEPQAHGFVRRKLWELASVTAMDNGATQVEFVTTSDAETLAIWPYAFTLTMQVIVGETLQMNLITHNQNECEIKITEALHTYYNLPVDQNVVLDGLQGAQEINTLSDNATRTIDGLFAVSSPIDSVYLNVQPTIEASVAGNPVFALDSNGQSSVVWNPGPETVKGFADIDDAHWPQFLCVENGNMWDNAVTIAPNSSHTLRVTVRKA